MSAQEVIEQIKHLPPAERAQVAKSVVENHDSWIPGEFKQGMADIAEGRVVDLDRDKQIEADPKAGRLDKLMEEARGEVFAA